MENNTMMNRTILFAGALLMGASFFVTERSAYAQEVMAGEIRLFGFNFCPEGWAAADGQLLSIAQNTSLYSLLGTTYGGDGRTTFALPDLRGRAPIHRGEGPGLSYYQQGERGGTEVVTLTYSELPEHNHHGLNLTSPDKGTHLVTTEQSGENTISVSLSETGYAGGSQAQTNMPPYLAMNYCIALVGSYPQRD